MPLITIPRPNGPASVVTLNLHAKGRDVIQTKGTAKRLRSEKQMIARALQIEINIFVSELAHNPPEIEPAA